MHKMKQAEQPSLSNQAYLYCANTNLDLGAYTKSVTRFPICIRDMASLLEPAWVVEEVMWETVSPKIPLLDQSMTRDSHVQ